MRSRWILVLVAISVSSAAMVQAPRHLNPVVDLLAQKKAVFGLYAPANPRGRRGGGAPPADAPPAKSPAELAKDAMAGSTADYLFDGTMEGDFDRGYAPFTEFMKGMSDAGMLKTAPVKSLAQPLFVKTHEIEPDAALANERIAKQLNLGVTGIVLVDVKSAEEAKKGIAAMRFKSQGGTRPDDVGNAPAVWGMSEAEYKQKADVWPLNPNGELVNFTIVESKEGLAKVREIAAVKGIGVLFPGAGTQLRRGSVGRRDPASPVGVQGVQRAVRLSGHGERHREAHPAGLQRLHHQLGRSRVPRGRHREEGRGTVTTQGAGNRKQGQTEGPELKLIAPS